MIIQTEIEISAPPMKVWRALCDFGSYPKWNPCREVIGVAGLGEKVTLMIGLNPEKRHRMPATINVFEPGRLLSFRTGRALLSKDLESFSLEPGRRGTLLRHSAELRGLSTLLMPRKWFEPRLLSVYQEVDRALEKYVTTGARLKATSPKRRRTRF
ncbi:MAG: SRPBCC domain-containing protein [Phenylobacterium sp.]|uniref:SRPBCC domain-containing protein n=1 Tax=Phenylobacterium sp. TaxID=1871053 RepID=UPI0027F0195B|nr:SRPBCC domain-containing protein [Phenylobacterium sp.]